MAGWNVDPIKTAARLVPKGPLAHRHRQIRDALDRHLRHPLAFLRFSFVERLTDRQRDAVAHAIKRHRPDASPPRSKRDQKIGGVTGLVLIAAEIWTGFGRSGDPFAFTASGIVPDLICTGGAIGRIGLIALT
ncbi:MAG: aminotransferase class III-fold pyridoxal phosphate-dependent enzyme [Geminicoccaceae bacterium]|nr:MAG: aminotransferase class III-fold pyridoxal phosphate-dependent enzyme [Geminicoccaceae bacterium]